MGDETIPNKKKGATLTKWMSMRFSKASTQGGASAVDEETSKRNSLQIASPGDIPGLNHNGSATVSGSKTSQKKKPALADIFGSNGGKPDEPARKASTDGESAFPGIASRGENDAEMKVCI